MKIDKDCSLKEYHTLAFDSYADYVVHLEDLKEVEPFNAYALSHKIPYRLIGEGSNLLIPEYFQGALVLLPKSKQYTILQETDSQVSIRIKGGFLLNQLIIEFNQKGFFGLEPLIGIPGTLSASVVQNVGAYGREIQDFIQEILFFDRSKGKWGIFSKKECDFSYRNSKMKKALGRFVITEITLKLSKNPMIELNYEALIQDSKKEDEASNVLKRVQEMRSKKLPKYSQFKNAGSYFKNPIISASKLKEMRSKKIEAPSFFHSSGIKLSAAYLIEHAGFKKGYFDEEKKVGSWKNHALILGHHGEGSLPSLLSFQKEIEQQVKKKYGILLKAEAEYLIPF